MAKIIQSKYMALWIAFIIVIICVLNVWDVIPFRQTTAEKVTTFKGLFLNTTSKHSNYHSFYHYFQLKTRLKGVNYKANHWFHISENFLPSPMNDIQSFCNTTISSIRPNVKHYIIYDVDNSKSYYIIMTENM